MNQNSGLKLYEKFLIQVDAFEQKVLTRYGEHIACRKGCSRCCILQSVFPVEAYIISEYLKSAERSELSNSAGGESCPFLDDDVCTVYPVRPVICRTHGYPILTEGGVDFCPDNFSDLDSIDSEYILSLDNLNKSLAGINMLFLKECSDTFFQKERVLLSEIPGRVT